MPFTEKRAVIHLSMTRIRSEFFLRDDVVNIARELIACTIHTNFNGQKVSALITETEAYNGVDDKAAHSFGGRLTERTRIMYGPGGIAYVYLCYGIHHLFNVVVGQRDVPKAVLLRAIWPLEGMEVMNSRRNKELPEHKIGAGPGTSSEALGIKTSHNGTDLQGDVIWLEERIVHPKENDIIVGPRIGVEYAEEDAELSYRFRLLPTTTKQLLNGALVEDRIHGNT